MTCDEKVCRICNVALFLGLTLSHTFSQRLACLKRRSSLLLHPLVFISSLTHLRSRDCFLSLSHTHTHTRKHTHTHTHTHTHICMPSQTHIHTLTHRHPRRSMVLLHLSREIWEVCTVWCNVLHCVAVCCSVLRCIAVCCNLRNLGGMQGVKLFWVTQSAFSTVLTLNKYVCARMCAPAFTFTKVVNFACRSHVQSKHVDSKHTLLNVHGLRLLFGKYFVAKTAQKSFFFAYLYINTRIYKYICGCTYIFTHTYVNRFMDIYVCVYSNM